MLWSGLLSLALLTLSSAITCPDGGACEDGSACCLIGSGRYGCCPLAHPLPMVRPSSGSEGRDTACLDGSHCPSEYSCVKSHSSYQCCPLPQGVSCSDGKHCCPEHHRCGEDGRSCIKEKDLFGAVICPDEESECPVETTCCQLPDKSWGCCPMAKVVCCKDGEHCCPEGFTCDTLHSKCLSPTRGDAPMWAKLPARKRAAWEDQTALQPLRDATEVNDLPTVRETSVPCPDGHQCPDGCTCCQLRNGSFGCCPYPNAVCCSDHMHCCPSGATCDLEHSACVFAVSQTPMAKNIPASKDVICPDKAKCPENNTCCRMADRHYGCCSLPRAVCCEDHIHCCPEGTECDTAHSACLSPSGNTAWITKLNVLKNEQAGDVPCDSTHACPDGTTCCKTEGGDWACCPLPKAVCCDDHIHCCPEGTTCDTAAGTCNKAEGSVPWLEKMPPLTHHPNKAGNVSCDSTHACPDGSTCCKTAEGGWACCPLPKAVCCDDHVHCCPEDTTCNVPAGSCDEATVSIPWLEKMPSLTHHPNKAGNVSCDSTHACPDGTTCCKTEGGDWACCPLPKAVCCDDHIHCCPEDTTCDTAAGTCNKAKGSVPWLEKMPALSRVFQGAKMRSPQLHRVACNATASCPDGTTCCLRQSVQQWGCCPLPTAVCCAGGEHCCPHGYTCDGQARCHKRLVTTPWSTQTGAAATPALSRDVQCDRRSRCAAGSTCCPLLPGQWGCCPLGKAVCCEDMKHCCPAGYTCGPPGGSCYRSGERRWDTWQGFFRKTRPLNQL